MLKPTFYFLFFLFYVVAYSQTNVGIKTVDITGEKKINDLLIEEKASLLLAENTDKNKVKINQELKDILSNELSKKEAFNFPFEKVKSISILTPTDSVFRLFSWHISYTDGSHSYECALLKRNKDESTNFYFLNEIDTENLDVENFIGNKDQWIGGLYYGIIEKSNSFQTYYTLLAWEGSDLLLNKKIIDVLWFDRAGNAKFGAPIFKSTTDTKSRVVFKYGGQNTMKLNYKPKLDRILFDHLSPPPANQNNTTNLEGVYEYYGADLSYDAYDWKKGNWIYVADVDADEKLSKSKRNFPEFKKEDLQKENAIYVPK